MQPTDPVGDRGIRLDTYYSDHLPVWCRFEMKAVKA